MDSDRGLTGNIWWDVKDKQRRKHARNVWSRVKFLLDEDLVLETWKEDKGYCTMTVYIPHEKVRFLRRTKWFSETVSFSGLVLDSVTLLSSPDLDYLRYRVRYNYI